MKAILKGAALLFVIGFAPCLVESPAAADDAPPAILKRLEELQRIVEEQQKIIAEQQRRLSAIEQVVISRERQQKGLVSAREARDQTDTSATDARKAVFAPGSRSGTSKFAQSEPEVPAPVAPVPPTTDDQPTEPSPSAAEPEGPPLAPVPPVEEAPATTPAGEPEVVPVPPAKEKAEPKPPEGQLVEERPEDIEKPIDELLLETGGVLLPEGTLQIEPLIDYTHTSTDRVNILGFTIFEAIVIGLIRVDEIERDIVRPMLNLRYGLADRIQLEASIPSVYRQDTELLGVGTPGQAEVTTDNFDIGDVEIGGNYQLLSQRTWTPATVLRLRGRLPTGTSAFDIGTTTVTVNEAQRTVLKETPTGSGFYAVAPGATFIWRADPVVFFGGGSYTLNLEREQGNFGKIDPGDTIEFFAGLNVALSDRVGLSLSFNDQLTGSTEQNGVKQVGTDVNDARIALGASYGVTPSLAILTSASIGLTDESPDFVFTVSAPFSFDLY